jgi:hypothetical protein
LRDLGGQHYEYGVTEEDYAPVAKTLLIVLAEIAGDAWSDELETAWGDALGAIAGLMLDGASRVAKKQPQLVGSSAAGNRSKESTSSANGERPESKTRTSKARSPARNQERNMAANTAKTSSVAGADQQVESLEKFYSMIESVPINVLLADADLNLVYMNESSTTTLKTLEEFLPNPVSELVGNRSTSFIKIRRISGSSSVTPIICRIPQRSRLVPKRSLW